MSEQIDPIVTKSVSTMLREDDVADIEHLAAQLGVKRQVLLRVMLRFAFAHPNMLRQWIKLYDPELKEVH